MRFAKISVKNDGVDLVREVKHSNGDTEHTELHGDGEPLSTFVDALQAFAPFVLDLLPITLDADVGIKITTLNLSADKNGLRGLIVTGVVPVEKAYGKPLVINTPLVREGAEEPSEDACILPDEVLELIELAELEASRYWNGERTQTEMFNRESSENAEEFNERAAAAEIATTRKPKRGRGKKSSGDVPPTTPVLRQLLLSIERDVPEEAIERWTSSERDAALNWAEARQKQIIGQINDVDVPDEPACVKRDATPSLADGWTDPHPPRVDDDAAQAIAAAVEHG